mmetsp:Transcript_12128/g.13714  ORF Transcript_12128/g.13714 Transcript_12128/m.13714 type:complete len:226 (+) Transcript_12128:424-1101(+)
MIMLPPSFNSLANWTRFLSPPLKFPTLACCDCPLKPNHERYARDITDCVPNSISSKFPEISSYAVFSGSNSSIRSCPTETIFTVSPTLIDPLSGSSFPISMLIKVDFPAPFGPTTPTMPAFGNEKLKSSINNRSPNDFFKLTTSITSFPNLGPGGMYICPEFLNSVGAAANNSSSYLLRRALDLFPCAFGFVRIHSNSFETAFAVAVSCFFSSSNRFVFVSKKVS